MNRRAAAVVAVSPFAALLVMACHTPSGQHSQHKSERPVAHCTSGPVITNPHCIPVSPSASLPSVVPRSHGGNGSLPVAAPTKPCTKPVTSPVTTSVAVSSPASPAVPPPPTPTTSAPAKGSPRPVHPVTTSSLVPTHGEIGTATFASRPNGLANTGADPCPLVLWGVGGIGAGLLSLLGAGAIKRRGRHT